MKEKRFTESHIFAILKEFDAGKNIQELSRGIGNTAYPKPLFTTGNPSMGAWR